MDRPDLQQLLDAGRVVDVRYRVEHGVATVCELELDSGFVVYGDASTTPQRFDETIGRERALQKALKTIRLFELYYDIETKWRSTCRPT